MFRVLTALVLSATSLQAQGLTLPLTSEGEVEEIKVSYACGDQVIPVTYLNAGEIRLALMPIEGNDRVFVNVVSGSGARYVSGAYVWWSKGDTATFEDEMTEGSLTECTAKEGLTP